MIRPASVALFAAAALLVGSASPRAATRDDPDTTPPSITPTLGGTLGASGWYTSDVSVSWDVVDIESAVGSTSGCDAVTLSAETAGADVSCSATNAVGLTATQTVSVKIDKTGPVVAAAPTAPPGATGWYTQPVSVAFSGSDPVSDVTSCTPTVIYAGPDAVGASVSGSCTNGAGLTTSASAALNYDASAPTVVAHVSGPLGSNGWYRGDVAVSWDVADPQSAIASASGCDPATYTADTPGTTVSCSATNGAGLAAQASVQFRIDRTSPETTMSAAPSSSVASSSAEFSFSSPEAGASFECSLEGGAFASCSSPQSYAGLGDGTHSFAVRAIDAAGNADPTPAAHTWTIRTAAPTLHVPADRVVEATGPNGAVVTYAVSAEDGTDPIPPDAISCAPQSGSTFKLGSTTVACTAKNTLGVSASGSFTVVVRDTSAPRLTVPAPMTLGAAVAVPASSPTVGAYLAAARAVDLVDPKPSLVSDIPVMLSPGTTVVTFTARDAVGNVASGKSSITIVAPDSSVPSAMGGAGATEPSRIDRTPPGDVQSVSVVSGDGSVALSWRRPTDPDFDHAEVFRADVAPGSAETSVYSGAKQQFVDRGVANGVQYRYVLVAVDTTGNRSGGVMVLAGPKASLLVSPKEAARLTKPPMLRWKRVAGARYYNVQLWRGGVKLLSSWPITNQLQLKRRWTHQGRRFTLTPGTYRWYVWPGLGARAHVRYGAILGRQTFTLTR
jgi:HYR domain